MSNSTVIKRVSYADSDRVQELIERCLPFYMSKDEVIDHLLKQFQIAPDYTKFVWEKLENQNPDFFKAYYLRLMVKNQIMEYNKLLKQHLHQMQQMHLNEVAPVPSTQGSAFNTDIASSSRRVDSPPNMFSLQATNMSNAYFNGGSSTLNTDIPSSSRSLALQGATNMIRSETPYSNYLPYMYGVETHSTVGDASIAATFSNTSRSQAVNDPLLDANTSPSDIMENYDKSSFNLADVEADDDSIAPIIINSSNNQSLNEPLLDAADTSIAPISKSSSSQSLDDPLLDASIAAFSNDSNSQSLNDPLLDAADANSQSLKDTTRY